MIVPNELEKVYLSRPFQTRNADEYDLENVLDLFIDPTEGLIGPFEFTNSIIKGKMGSGKTMYLRANYAYYLYTLVPCLLDSSPIILPVYIRLSDFQNIHNPEKIYNAVIVKIIEEIVAVCKHLQSAEELARLHKGASTLTGLWSTEKAFIKVLEKLRRITAEEYVEKVTDSFGAKGSVTATFLSAYTDYEKNIVSEMKRQEKPSFQNIIDTCKQLLTPFNGKLLILLDEIGSTNKSFFKSDEDGDSYFEILMNQLRTLPDVRTKLAVYPHSYSDILKETRYGDIVELECDIANNDVLYKSFMTKTVSLIERYIEKASGIKCRAEDVFDISIKDQLMVEQFINASEGNMRRLVHLLDSTMNMAYFRCQGKDRAGVEDVWNALRKQGAEMESLFQDGDKVFLERLAKVCRSRSTYRFQFPYKSVYIGKYANMSEEYNIVNVQEAGSGRKGTIYSFDYAYCVYKDIPTHYIKNTEKIDKLRSRITGEPIKRVAQLSDELLMQTEIHGKIEGVVKFVADGGRSGFVDGEDNETYFITMNNVITSDRKKKFYEGDKLRFVPSKLDEDSLMAISIEIL